MLAPLSAIRPAMAAIADALSGLPMHGHVGAALAAGPVVAGPPVDLDGHAEVRGGALDGVAQPLPVPRGGDQHAEHQPAPEHDLLDVEHLDAGAGQRREDRRGDPGPVLAGQRDQQGLRAWLVSVVGRVEVAVRG